MSLLYKTGIFLQARLNSKRLPGKALYELCGKSLIAHSLKRLSIVPADLRVILTSKENNSVLESIAKEYGWDIFYGDEQNVLQRFVEAIKYYKVDIVIRATADNPLLSSEIARETIDLFHKKSCDLSYLAPVPYGSGVEVINAKALMEALKSTTIPYNLEHVSPFIYQHNEKFKVEYTNFHDKEISRDDIRLSVDSNEDFDRVNFLIRNIENKNKNYKIKSIINEYDELDFVKYKRILCISACSDNYGMGHIKRLSLITKKLSKEFNIYISLKYGSISTCNSLFNFDFVYMNYNELRNHIKKEGIFERVIVDLRDTTLEEMQEYKKYGPVISFDDMGFGGKISDCNIKSLPYFDNKTEYLFNYEGIKYLFLDVKKQYINQEYIKSNIQNILITFGGSDPQNLSYITAETLFDLGYNISIIVGPYFKANISDLKKFKIIENTNNINEHIFNTDLVITSFGITFFETLYLKKPVILINPTNYHDLLTEYIKYPYYIKREKGEDVFKNIKKKISDKIFKVINENAVIESKINETPLFHFFNMEIGKKNNEIISLIKNYTYSLPICPNCSYHSNNIISRTIKWNMYKCEKCNLYFIYNIMPEEKTDYEEKYFIDDYKKQYGKTYEEDKINILRLSENRLKMIKKYVENGRLLDFGSGLGFFSEFCEKNGFKTISLDISKYAVEFIKNNLNLKAFNSDQEYLEKTDYLFNVITSFYVIEHIKDFKKLLFLFKCHLCKDGLLVLSTPNSAGISVKHKFEDYIKKHPDDHFIILSPKIIKKILLNMGFHNIKIIITGIHINRFIKSKMLLKNRLICKIVKIIAKIFNLGDTFEIYAQKK